MMEKVAIKCIFLTISKKIFTSFVEECTTALKQQREEPGLEHPSRENKITVRVTFSSEVTCESPIWGQAVWKLIYGRPEGASLHFQFRGRMHSSFWGLKFHARVVLSWIHFYYTPNPIILGERNDALFSNSTFLFWLWFSTGTGKKIS